MTQTTTAALAVDVRTRLSQPLVRAIDADRHLGHAHVMTAFPAGLGESPRATAQVLWDLDREAGELTVRSPAIPPHAENLGAIIAATTVTVPADEMTIRFSRNVQRCPVSRVDPDQRAELKAGSSGYRSRLVIVPEEEREAWALALLARSGFSATQLRISSRRSISLGARRGGRVPCVTVTARGVITDESTFAKALTNGVGKAKNYGLGLIHILPTDH